MAAALRSSDSCGWNATPRRRPFEFALQCGRHISSKLYTCRIRDVLTCTRLLQCIRSSLSMILHVFDGNNNNNLMGLPHVKSRVETSTLAGAPNRLNYRWSNVTFYFGIGFHAIWSPCYDHLLSFDFHDMNVIYSIQNSTPIKPHPLLHRMSCVVFPDVSPQGVCVPTFYFPRFVLDTKTRKA